MQCPSFKNLCNNLITEQLPSSPFNMLLFHTNALNDHAHIRKKNPASGHSHTMKLKF